MKIQPIVEGQGEVAAVPVLLRRLVEKARAWKIKIEKPIRAPRSHILNEERLRKLVTFAVRQRRCDAILIMFDGDRDCPAELGMTVHKWAVTVASHIPCEVVIPQREYEAWFLATIESLRGHSGIKNDAIAHHYPEAPYGAKEQLEAQMQVGKSYLETKHQASFSAQFSMEDAFCRCRSFRKLTTSFGSLLQRMGQDVAPWPPSDWLAGLERARGETSTINKRD